MLHYRCESLGNHTAVRRAIVAVLVVVALGFLTPRAVQAQQKVDWRQATTFPNLPLNQLTSTQKTAVINRLRAADCPCGCGMKMAECLIDDPTCPRSPGIARQIVADVKQQVGDWRTATSFPNLSFAGMTASQTAEAIRRLRAADCPCGCGMKIAECLIDDPTCPSSPGISRDIVAQVRQNTASNENARRGKLHVIMVVDRYDEKIGEHCRADEEFIASLIEHNVAGRDCKFDLTMEDLNAGLDRITQQNVISRIQRLRINPNDTVLFYFSGHGGYTPETGQSFSMHHENGGLMKRDVVRAAIKRLNPKLGIIISDCCYTLIKPATPGVMARHPNDRTRPLMESLFFQHSGFVDITSSKQGQVSYCLTGGRLGGVFTVAFSEMAEQQMDRQLSWSQFFSLVAEETENSFDRFHPKGDSANGQTDQTPYAFSLGN